ncbi:MAG: adenylate cyclase [Verrucomicrobiota bacterium]|jgi:class 3 adenylate cyclase
MKTSLKHELRTPLNHIIGYCEMLMEDAQDRCEEALIADLRRIHLAGRRLLAIINDLFDATKLPSEKLSESALHHEIRTPLNQIIGYAEMMQEEAQERGQAEVVDDLGKIRTAARQLLQTVVERLVPTQFDIARAAHTETGGHTTFFRREPPATGARSPGAEHSFTGRLLVADDDEGNRTMLLRRLIRLGHSVELAVNGRDALEKLRRERFDLLLLDIQMPELNGYQVLEQIKADPALRELPVIVLSASSGTERVAHCVELGAEDYLPKPFDPVLLQARIGACLEKKRLRDREVSHLRQIEQEKKRADDLLHIILPQSIAEELKATSVVKPRRFENVGVLFCDISGFTAYCDQHPPEEVHRHLQALIETFERLVAEYGLEKIKTIGDSFMATAGLLAPMEDPPLACIHCGLAMLDAARAQPPYWEIRVGVEVGPVIAGVVGLKKFQFDVWGDTVNVAARLEQAAPPGALCVTRDTWSRVRTRCRGESMGRVALKGKGDVELFRIDSLHA